MDGMVSLSRQIIHSISVLRGYVAFRMGFKGSKMVLKRSGVDFLLGQTKTPINAFEAGNANGAIRGVGKRNWSPVENASQIRGINPRDPDDGPCGNNVSGWSQPASPERKSPPDNTHLTNYPPTKWMEWLHCQGKSSIPSQFLRGYVAFRMGFKGSKVALKRSGVEFLLGQTKTSINVFREGNANETIRGVGKEIGPRLKTLHESGGLIPVIRMMAPAETMSRDGVSRQVRRESHRRTIPTSQTTLPQNG
jgi:hypothetical protein